jgi:hypothetical protein
MFSAKIRRFFLFPVVIYFLAVSLHSLLVKPEYPQNCNEKTVPFHSWNVPG